MENTIFNRAIHYAGERVVGVSGVSGE